MSLDSGVITCGVSCCSLWAMSRLSRPLMDGFPTFLYLAAPPLWGWNDNREEHCATLKGETNGWVWVWWKSAGALWAATNTDLYSWFGLWFECRYFWISSVVVSSTSESTLSSSPLCTHTHVYMCVCVQKHDFHKVQGCSRALKFTLWLWWLLYLLLIYLFFWHIYINLGGWDSKKIHVSELTVF